jgi:hypothetical protein
MEPDVVGEPVVLVVGEEGAIDERGGEWVLQKISGDDGVKDFVEGFDGWVIEIVDFEGEG